MTRLGSRALVLFVAILSRPARAQRVLSSVDLSGTNVWYGDSIRAAGASLTPAVRLDWNRATLAGSASISGLGGGNVSTQGTLAPSIFTPSAGAFFGELAGAFGGSTHQDGTHTGQMLGMARGYVAARARGAWLGGGLGRTWDGSTWRGVRQAELGGWFESGPTTMLATVTPVVVADTTRYTDLQVALRHPTSRVEVGVSAGARTGASGYAIEGTSRAWGSASVTAWLTETQAIVATAGTYPVDLTQGFPGGRYISIGFRVSSRNERAAMRPSTTTDRTSAAEPAAALAVTAFEVQSPGGNRRVLRVRAVAATSVELSGDFTRWQPVAMQRAADGWWTLAQTIAPGSYQMNVRVNGGPWLAPPGLITSRDEFGGVTAVLKVE